MAVTPKMVCYGVLFLVLTVAAVRLTNSEFVPPVLAWSKHCEQGYHFCATLEFCGNGTFFGYVLPGILCSSGPGPIVRVQQGKRYKLTLVNKANVVTNLHTHGLHVGGSGNADDVTRSVSPGQCVSYAWDIVDNHPGGSFWYHPHQHGLAAEQVKAGAYGLLIVEDEKPTPSRGVELWQKSERMLVIAAKERNCKDRRHGGPCDPHRRHAESHESHVGPPPAGSRGNGKLNEQFVVIANEWYRFRISIVDADGHPQLLQFGKGCNVHLTARDGVWRSSVPAEAAATYRLPGSARADFAVLCTTVGDAAEIVYDGDVVATLHVVAGHQSDATPFHDGKPWQPARAGFIADTLQEHVPDENKYYLNTTNSEINGLTWDALVPHRVIAFGAVHEWTVEQSRHHPFHLHVYHMQVATPGGCGDHEYGEWYDTIASAEPCTVRFRAVDFGQRVVFHCHVLRHEDGGAMGWVDVQGAGMRENEADGRERLCSAAEKA